MIETKIVPMASSDVDKVLNLIDHMYEDDNIVETPRSEERVQRTRNFVESSLTQDLLHISVAKRNDEIIACSVSLIVDNIVDHWLKGNSFGYIRWMVVDPKLRNQGIGSSLMEEALRWFKSNGVSTYQLHSSVGGKPLYEKFGFSPPENENMWMVSEE